MAASRSPLNYTGNKGCLIPQILALMPEHQTYVEPCMGSAEVFFCKPPAPLEILNDYNGDLVNFFRTIQSSRKLSLLLGRLYLSVNAEQLFQENRVLLNSVPNVLDDLRETAEQAERLSWQEIRRAAAFLENQFYSFSSTGQSYGIAARDITSRLPRLIAAYKRLRNAVILHRDYKDAIRYAAGPETFIFLDPPYRGTEDCYPKGDFSSDEHAELFRFLHDLHRTYGGRCRFLVTYNNDPYIRALAEQHGFQASVVSRLDNMRQSKGGGTQYEELLITNYDQQEQAAKNRQVVSMEQAQFSLF